MLYERYEITSRYQQYCYLYFCNKRAAININFYFHILQNQLASSHVKEFTNTILSEIFLLQRLNSYTKFTISINQRVLYNNYIPLDNDYKSCRVLTDSLTTVIKQSLDVEFKENCFSMLNAENSHEVKTALMCKLLPLIHDNYTLSKTN